LFSGIKVNALALETEIAFPFAERCAVCWLSQEKQIKRQNHEPRLLHKHAGFEIF
jgi:hypothetical protein